MIVGADVSIRNVLDTWGREAVLLFFMTAHWRKPIDFTDETLAQAKAQVETFRNFFLDPPGSGGIVDDDKLASVLDDDFNTPDALALFHEWRSRGDWPSLRRGLSVFGLESITQPRVAPTELLELAKQRQEARARKDFAESDRLRDEILDAGWVVRDVAEPPGFRLVPRS